MRRFPYDPAQYDCRIIRLNGGAGKVGVSYASGAGSDVMLITSGLESLNHECGHTKGLGHARSWDTIDGTAYGRGSINEYGNIFDTMGVGDGFCSHYNTTGKRGVLRWLPAPPSSTSPRARLMR